MPTAQLPTHEPLSKYGVPVVGQLRHDVLPAAEHSLQVLAQAEQVVTPSMTSTKVPSLGHSATHAPPYRNGAAALVHVRHSALEGPLHVPHEASQGWQTLLESAYLPLGVHVARHVPASKKGCVEAHVTHSVAAGPVHVAHDAWHG